MKETVRLAIVGVGCRGSFWVEQLLHIPHAELTAVCDVYTDRVEAACAQAEKLCGRRPLGFTDYREMLERAALDGVLIATNWERHFEIAIAAMKKGVRPGIEAGGANTVEDGFALVRTSEETGVPCMILENCCYGREEMAVLNMVKKGLFGELIHCEAGYAHDLRDEICLGTENRHYRLAHYLSRNGDNYPTHGIGPMANCLNINRGNRFVMLTSMASKEYGLSAWVKAHLPADHELAGKRFVQGDVVTTMLKCANGETVLLTLSTSLPRAYSRCNVVQGANGMWMEDGRHIHIEGRSKPHLWEDFDPYMEEFDHPLWKEYRQKELHALGHGGMDYLVGSAFVESIREGTEPPLDVYDAAVYSAITALSEQSVALGSMPVAFPDFTHGAWMHRSPSGAGKYALDRIPEELF